MANIAIQRVKREFLECQKDDVTSCGIELQLEDSNNMQKLIGVVSGAVDTPYEGGTFLLSIEIADSYPFTPPKVVFLTKIWHPNISSQTGVICLDILKDAWAAAMTLRTVLLSIQGLMQSPEPDDPQDAVVAKQYKNDYAGFCKHAKEWTSQFAGSPKEDYVSNVKVKLLMEMGFSEDACKVALNAKEGNVEAAIDYLFST